MPAKATARAGTMVRSLKRKPVDAATQANRATRAGTSDEPDDWTEEVEQDNDRLEEGEMEILLTGHAATHGIEGEDNWLISTEEEKWGER